jgi:M6 family metalloprotease-like protein
VSRSAAVEGDLPLIAVPALFLKSDPPHISAEALEESLFSGANSLHAFWAEASGGRLEVTGEVTPWVRTSYTLEEVVGDSYGLGSDTKVGEYLVEALTLVDPDVDFGQYDNDGPDNIPNSGDDNGVVDAIAFYFLEVAASCGGPGIWPHFYGIGPRTGSAYETDDLRPDGSHVRIDPYFIQSIADCSGTQLGSVGTIAHESGHLLGLPDLYHQAEGLLPEQRRWVVGCWSLMAAGSWGCGPIDNPAPFSGPTHPGAWEKKQMGWLDEIVTVVDVEVAEVTLGPVETTRRILELPLGSDERLLIEYRDTVSFDRELPAAGVLVYAVNDTVPFRPDPVAPPVYRVKLLEADNDSALVETYAQGGDRGVAGDAYGVLGPGSLTDLTEPSTRHNGGLGAASGVRIYSITLENGGARIVLSTAPISLQRLLGPLLLDEENALTEAEEGYLDASNNENGRFDVGDLRAYLQRNP